MTTPSAPTPTRRPHALATAAAVLAALLVTGCGDEEADDLPDGPDVSLLDAGSGDKRVLELDVEEGQQATTTTTSEQLLDGEAFLPPITYTLDSEVTDVDDDRVEATQVYRDVSLDDGGDPQAAEVFGDVVDDLVGTTATLTFLPNGAAVDGDVDVPDDADAQVRQVVGQLSDQLSSLATPFPDEEVGEGAQWETTTETTLQGIRVEQTITYTLSELDGDRYTIDFDTRQVVTGSEEDGGAGSGSGTGTIEGDLGSVVPLRLHSENESTFEMGTTSVTSSQTVDGTSELG